MKLCLDLPNSLSLIGQWFYDWQTLIGGVLALMAALWAGSKVQYQIRQVDTLHRNELLRRRNSARVMLPFALSSILAFCQKAGTNLAVAIEVLQEPICTGDDGFDNVIVAPSLNQIEFPSSAIDALARFVECLDDNEQEKHVAELVAQLQIFHAKYEEQSDNTIPHLDSLYMLLVSAGTVKFLVETVFNYARFTDNASFAKVGAISQPDAWLGIKKSMLGLVFDRPAKNGFINKIDSIIDREIEVGTSPWIEKFEV